MLKNAGEDSGGFAVTDHGHINSAGYFAAAQKKFKQKGTPVKLLWGLEAYYIPSIDEWSLLKHKSDEQKAQEKEKKKKKEDDEEEGLVFENEKESKAKYFDPIKRRNHLVLVAQNQEGLKNLFRLVTRSHREGFYRKPRIDFKMLKDCNQGLVASTACLAGVPSWCSLQALSIEEAHKMYDKELSPLMELFGPDRFFLELQFNRIPEQQLVNEHIVKYSQKTGYKLIATADAHYPKPENWKDREIYRMLGYQTRGEEIDKSILEKSFDDLDAQLFLKNGDQMFAAYKASEFGKNETNDQLIKEAIERSYDIAHNLCETVFPDDKVKLPKPLQMKEGSSAFETLSELAFNGLKKKKLADNKEYFDRLVYELKIIKKLNLENYFLTLKDIIDSLKKEMLIGPGRGSGAGSLLNYSLGITLVDPIKNGLLFERFLSPSKAEADVDNDVELRKGALDILKKYFGEENVIAISNYNKLQLKSIVKDLSRLHNVPFQEVNKVTSVMEIEAKKKILAEINHDQKLYEFTFDKAKKHSPTFAAFVEKYPNVAENIEALYQEIKSIGKHAGGIILVPNAEECIPVIRIKDKDTGKYIDQSPITEGITAQHAKFFGLIKYDVLGLATLKIIRRCIEIILRDQGILNPTIENVWDFYDNTLHPDVIDPENKVVLENVYWEGKFPSIFQFEEEKVQEFVKKAKPKNVDEISQITALYRPGALGAGADKTYLYSEVRSQHPIMDKILFPTRNCLIYQEQFLQLAHELAGFTLEEADVLRKILVKPAQDLGAELRKKREEYRERFIQGCIQSGLTEKRATLLWDDEIAHYISYGFNKSHSICYAYNSYACAWLFTYYPLAWMKACLEEDPEPQKVMNTIRSLGYDVSKVDVNFSAMDEWSYANDKWLPALTSLKGLGEAGANELIRLRPKEGFKDINDFCFNEYKNWRWSKLNKRCLESLIKSESFNSLKAVGKDNIFKNYKHLYDFFMTDFDKLKKGKLDLNELTLSTEGDDWTVAEKVKFQQEIVGFYDKSLVINKFMPAFKQFDIVAIDDYSEENGPKNKVWGIVHEIEKKVSKNDKVYYTVSVSGNSEKIFRFKAWLKETDLPLWSIGNILVFSLDYSEDWGYSLSKKLKPFVVNK